MADPPPLDFNGLNLPKDLPKPPVAAKVETVAVEPPFDLEKFCYYRSILKGGFFSTLAQSRGC